MANTPEQQAAIEAAKGEHSLTLEAVAGSGKTFTLRQMAAARRVQTLALAFNKRNADDLQAKLPSHCEARTMNALGHRALLGFLAPQLKLDTGKTSKLVSEFTKSQPRGEDADDGQWLRLRKLLDGARNAGLVPSTWKGRQAIGFTPDTEDGWDAIADAYDIDLRPGDVEVARRLLCQSNDLALKGTIDFADQIYLSCVLRAPFRKFARLIVDEAQDLSPLQHFMVQRSLQPKGQIFLAGDPKQAIYAWRGASSSSLSDLSSLFATRALPLSYCFRCSAAVVEEAQQYVPWIKHPANAVRGSVQRHAKWGPESIQPGSAILCARNAPLVKLAFELIRARRGIQMLGRDFGAGLKALIKRSRAQSIVQLELWLEGYQTVETQKALAKFNEAKADRVADQCDSIRALCEDARDVDQLLEVIETLFSKESRDITLATLWKAKGMEWPNVFYVDNWQLPGRAEPGTVRYEQSLNARYVATTRAQVNLHYVNSKDFQE